MSETDVKNCENTKNNEKSAVNNQWITTGKNLSDNRERRDGPGGESSSNK